MTDLRLCTKRAVSFAAVASFSVALAGTALGEGSESPDGSVTISDAEVAAGFTDTGDTCDNFDDLDVVCPFTGSEAPDVFYAYTPSADTAIHISLCDSAYDTKTYVLDGSFIEIACNDDGPCGPSGFQSEIECVELEGGETYHIAVDGFDKECGAYSILIETCTPRGPCVVKCPPGGIDEGEPCGDELNDGCNASEIDPPLDDIACGDTICGSAFADAGFRDTDWYERDSTGDASSTVYTWSATAEYQHVVGLVNTGGSGDCEDATGISPFADAAPCEEASIETVPLAPGRWWFFAGPLNFDFVPCGVGEPLGNDYFATLECEAGGGVCPGDIDGDNTVGFTDLLRILNDWGPCPPPGG